MLEITHTIIACKFPSGTGPLGLFQVGKWHAEERLEDVMVLIHTKFLMCLGSMDTPVRLCSKILMAAQGLCIV